MKKLVLLLLFVIIHNIKSPVFAFNIMRENERIMCSSDTCGSYDQKFNPKTGLLYKPAYYE